MISATCSDLDIFLSLSSWKIRSSKVCDALSSSLPKTRLLGYGPTCGLCYSGWNPAKVPRWSELAEHHHAATLTNKRTRDERSTATSSCQSSHGFIKDKKVPCTLYSVRGVHARRCLHKCGELIGSLSCNAGVVVRFNDQVRKTKSFFLAHRTSRELSL